MSCLKVEVRDKTYQDQTRAIENLVLEAEAGEFVAIVGPSGAGKTTLLNIIAGIDQQADSDIQWSNTQQKPDAETRAELAFMFQESRLMPWMTAAENIGLVLPDAENTDENIAALLDEVELSGFADHYPSQLSGGMKRRVALARAFSVKPRLLLMDEPFQSLDAPTATRLRQLLLEFWGSSQSVILFVTHELREAVMLADRIVFLTERPASVLTQITVDLPRPRNIDSAEVAEFCSNLNNQWPGLLSGKARPLTLAESSQPEGSVYKMEAGR